MGLEFFKAFFFDLKRESMFDQKYFKNYSQIIGCDEVGRGPIAGPVVGCAVKIENNLNFLTALMDLGVTDSKKLNVKKREKILVDLNIPKNLKTYTKYTLENFSFVLWEHSPAQIDEMNILNASLSCMKNAALELISKNSIVLIDGNRPFKNFDYPLETIVKGDSKSLVIALASIIAKEFRDKQMIEWDKKFPGYGLSQHAGYPTKFHKEAVKNLGITPIHRKSFKGVKEFVEQ